MEPCKSYWWTALFYVNNFYPKRFDDKCMNWTWYLSSYIQLSIFLPLIILIYKKVSLKLSILGYTILFTFFFFLNIIRIAVKDIGALPAFNDKYYAEIFMRPAFHFNEYLLGVIMSLIYMRFIKERALSN